MTDIDRYITDEAVDAAAGSYSAGGIDLNRRWARHILRAAIPHIVALVRADVLREAADYLSRDVPPGQLRTEGSRDLQYLAALADRAVAE